MPVGSISAYPVVMKLSTNSTDAITLLKEQHREVESLFEQIEQASDTEDKESLFQELADNLAAHSTIEEKIFYPAAYAKQTKDMLTEAVEEHLSVKRLLTDLLQMSPEHENFDAKIKVLKEQIEHHVEEEEKELFPQVEKDMNSEKLETLGAQMEEMFEEELDNEPSENVPAETGEAARLR
jgi:hemerythrin-like domain-containing protein